ncbi:hypothetical protein CONPUDRAFT_165695 [Coniophora puteana RWD-64-598 SS2]|uniref:CENP-V/GFA domain-containing protein n=1 Tax=Coniophora puteana (strain RWD-64-598) TaxID=741705 RepID=A0A5M3MR83_CONPW|nr:uncharacterized protein CONPUDRAFT_165695 [Coniophora puteana RWD-64-598 SS2]EIW81590.1 hypothetical protein CONPUDRAFT_165695 [Coniophora puteana RWD-64-598 SS2]
MSSEHKGSCLCQAIQYRITTSKPIGYTLCHCIDCQKVSGSTYAANLFILKSDFHLTKGEDSLSTYSTSATFSGSTLTRHFCKTCGSFVFSTTTSSDKLIVLATGCLDGHPEWKPTQEIFCSHRRAWLQELENTKRFEKMNPGRNRAKL